MLSWTVFLRTGKSSDVRFSSTEKLEVVPMIAKKMEYSYKDRDDYVFSDPETYETVSLGPDLIGDNKNYLAENAEATVTFINDKAVAVELPSSVVLEVTDAPEGIKGDSANNVQKPITLETGTGFDVSARTNYVLLTAQVLQGSGLVTGNGLPQHTFRIRLLC